MLSNEQYAEISRLSSYECDEQKVEMICTPHAVKSIGIKFVT